MHQTQKKTDRDMAQKEDLTNELVHHNNNTGCQNARTKLFEHEDLKL